MEVVATIFISITNMKMYPASRLGNPKRTDLMVEAYLLDDFIDYIQRHRRTR
ncbi:hypothetical protein Hydth_0522 [Hydrogenobacter thermophilus TK-6]|uniref:Uncharacterized protein n=1 Tax=Hydrogenobacter thermophilus (strain DSM 6534 / IAM 12695 / TK-6) TaxID=608538 RepID=D3DGN6_HYDTT|nr:hypothetical protein [Hydrogenobacter thermophilus]ADO44922.1 hypothetical protein Hydth_0522 [Hydrogenobacter thermophilus TK-6]BAI68988.1 hypothetical protein HTH_0524 [Hydrogenobacter thermophilus TK-6]